MTLASRHYDIIYTGNYTKDTIITPEGTRFGDGGGANFAAAAGARLGLKVAAVTRLAKEDNHMADVMQKANVDYFPTFSPNSTQITLEYKTDNVDQRSLYVKSFAGTISPSQLDGLKARAIVVSPSLRGEVEPAFFKTVRSSRGEVWLSADVQGFIRVLHNQTLVHEPWPQMPEVLAEVDILKADAVEAEYLTGESEIEKAARAFASLGPREIIITHSEGVMIYAEGKYHHYRFHSKSMSGRSGRGDTCVGSYVAKRLSLPPQEAGKWAAAVTSLKVERMGMFDRPVEEVERFIQQHYSA